MTSQNVDKFCETASVQLSAHQHCRVQNVRENRLSRFLSWRYACAVGACFVPKTRWTLKHSRGLMAFAEAFVSMREHCNKLPAAYKSKAVRHLVRGRLDELGIL